MPISICTVEELFFEVTVKTNILIFDKDAALIAHITRRGTRVLVIMTVVFNGESLRRSLPVAANRELLGIVT